VSGNAAGRPRGSKNKGQRRAADLERAAHWTPHDWRAFHRLAARKAEGNLAEKQAAAASECIALWLLLNPAHQQPGLCAQCAKPLDVPRSTVNGAPIRADGAWVHWGCLPWFLFSRWGAARAGLQWLGIVVGDM
jgi:hypothetical protein